MINLDSSRVDLPGSKTLQIINFLVLGTSATIRKNSSVPRAEWLAGLTRLDRRSWIPSYNRNCGLGWYYYGLHCVNLRPILDIWAHLSLCLGLCRGLLSSLFSGGPQAHLEHFHSQFFNSSHGLEITSTSVVTFTTKSDLTLPKISVSCKIIIYIYIKIVHNWVECHCCFGVHIQKVSEICTETVQQLNGLVAVPGKNHRGTAE